MLQKHLSFSAGYCQTKGGRGLHSSQLPLTMIRCCIWQWNIIFRFPVHTYKQILFCRVALRASASKLLVPHTKQMKKRRIFFSGCGGAGSDDAENWKGRSPDLRRVRDGTKRRVHEQTFNAKATSTLVLEWGRFQFEADLSINFICGRSCYSLNC